ncbi:DUF6233 domain-containing protein [Streptomyces sp. NPDC001068]|uniref:DUF6233 domain-containing protein n=1 Tax=Streptomyces sp. NPDC001068 TaxID=3364544 RepID=UPI0036C06E8B
MPCPAYPEAVRPPALTDRRDTAVHTPTRFIVELPEKAGQDALIHTSCCTKTLTRSRPIEADLARQGLVNDPRGFTACTGCCPDTELGIDVARPTQRGGASHAGHLTQQLTDRAADRDTAGEAWCGVGGTDQRGHRSERGERAAPAGGGG